MLYFYIMLCLMYFKYKKSILIINILFEVSVIVIYYFIYRKFGISI